MTSLVCVGSICWIECLVVSTLSSKHDMHNEAWLLVFHFASHNSTHCRWDEQGVEVNALTCYFMDPRSSLCIVCNMQTSLLVSITRAALSTPAASVQNYVCTNLCHGLIWIVITDSGVSPTDLDCNQLIYLVHL